MDDECVRRKTKKGGLDRAKEEEEERKEGGIREEGEANAA